MKVTMALLFGMTLLGCSTPEHLTPSYGDAYKAAFATQASPAKTKHEQAERSVGLDPQEAAIIAEGYRESLAREGQHVEEQPVLLVAPTSNSNNHNAAQ